MRLDDQIPWERVIPGRTLEPWVDYGPNITTNTVRIIYAMQRKVDRTFKQLAGLLYTYRFEGMHEGDYDPDAFTSAASWNLMTHNVMRARFGTVGQLQLQDEDGPQ